MVYIEPFHVDHYAEYSGSQTTKAGVKYNLANTNSPPVSVSDLEGLPEHAPEQKDWLSTIHHKPMDYGTWFNGLPALCDKIADLYSGNWSNVVSPDNVLTTSGASLANFIVLYALLGPGDHVIVPYPTYQQFQVVPVTLGAETSPWNAKAENNWQLDVDDLKKLIRPNTKMIIVNNPQNPTGAITPSTTLKIIVDIAAEHDIILFSDEIYHPISHSFPSKETENPRPMLSFGYKKTVTTNSLSKSYSLAGIRVGWLTSNDSSIIRLCENARSYCLITMSQVDEHIANFALEYERIHEIVVRNKALAEQNATIVDSFVREDSSICEWVKPVGGPIGFIKCSRAGKPIDDYVLCDRAYEKRGLLIVPGNRCFGGDKDFPGYVRLGFGVDAKSLQAGLDQLRAFIKDEWDSLPLADLQQ